MNDIIPYQDIRQEMQTGDLLLWSGKGAISGLIKFFGKSDYSHASMVLRIDEYMEDRVMQMGAVRRGFYPTPLSSELDHYKGSVYWLPLKPEYDKYRNRMGCEALQISGVAYDFSNVIRNLLGYVSIDLQKMFCSEAYQWVGYKAGLPILDGYETLAMRPGDLSKLGWNLVGKQIK